MTEYIVSQELIEDVSGWGSCYACKWDGSDSEDRPCRGCTNEDDYFEINGTELIRCKDCKYYNLDGVLVCDRFTDASLRPDDYCSYGERKEV